MLSFSCWVVSNSLQPWTIALQAPLSMGFSRQAYWSALPFPSPGDLPDPELELGSPALQADSLPLSHQGSPGLPIKTLLWLLPTPVRSTRCSSSASWPALPVGQLCQSSCSTVRAPAGPGASLDSVLPGLALVLLWEAFPKGDWLTLSHPWRSSSDVTHF